jgi:hypothetical protein
MTHPHRTTRPDTTRARQDDERMPETSGTPTRHADVYAAARLLIQSGYRGDARTCRCGAPHADHAGDRHRGGVPRTGCKAFRRDRAEQAAEMMLAAANSNPMRDIATYLALGKRPRKGLHASDAGACPKAIEYRISPPPGYTPLPARDEAATLGTIYHQALAAARRHLYPWRVYEHPVTLPGLAEEPSTFDEYDEALARITDAKTAEDWMWGEVEHAPYPKHVKQLLVYGYALTQDGKPVLTLRLEYVHRGTGDVRVHDMPYNHSAAVRAIGELRAVAAALDAGMPLPRGEEYTGPTTSVICGAYCPARDHCWGITAAAATRRSPESLTLLGPDPRVNEDVTAWALETYLEAKRAKTAADIAYKRAKTLLQGIPDGVYGDYAYADNSRPARNVTTWSAAARKEFLIWKSTPEPDRWDLGAALDGIPMTSRYEHHCTVKPAPTGALPAPALDLRTAA